MDEPVSAGIRASDEERQQTADRLREHFAAGRLTLDEFEQRTGAVYAAKTRDELAVTTRDLPDTTLPPPAAASADAASRRRAFIWEAFGIMTLFVVCVAIWLASGRGQFWPVWVGIVGGLRVARSAQTHLGSGAGGHGYGLERRRMRDERRARRHHLPPPP